jgi:hypothetical protein
LQVYALMRGPLIGNRGPLYGFSQYHDEEGITEERRYEGGKLGPMPGRPSFEWLVRDQVNVPGSYQNTVESMTIGKIAAGDFEAFGFLKVNGNWIDPDSEAAIYSATNDHSDISNPILPTVHSSFGPYILSQSEQDVVYGEFVDDEDDGEGDPRDGRISPETFAMLAEGVVKLDLPQYEVVKPVSKTQIAPNCLHIIIVNI